MIKSADKSDIKQLSGGVKTLILLAFFMRSYKIIVRRRIMMQGGK